MSGLVRQFGDHRVLVPDVPKYGFAPPALANDLISLAWEHEVQIIAISADVLPSQFFDLRSGLLGEVTQKFANYRLHLVVLGDVAVHTASSKAFRDYVYEANKGQTLWFAPDLEALEQLLTGASRES